MNIVTYDMIHQVSLSSCEFPGEVNEFTKAGFTEEPATLIKPPMVKESKVKLECKVIEVKPLGSEGGAGNLVICEVMRMHIDDSLLDDPLPNSPGLKKIDQRKIHHIARLGGDWYCKVDETNLFHVPKPNTELGIGIDALPESIRKSEILSGNNLGQLANVKELHLYAKKLLDKHKVKEAWQVLLANA